MISKKLRSDFQDLTNKVFGKLTVIEYFGKINHITHWKCICGCNKIEVIVSGSNLKRGATKSCGCLLKIHSLSKSLERNSYRAAKERCENLNNNAFKDYGGRGIKFLYKSLLEMISDIGMRPSKNHSIERINNEGNYEIGNVKWALVIEQSRNKRNNVDITYDGKTQCLKDWAFELNISYNTLHSRINKLNWCIPCSFTIRVNKNIGEKGVRIICPHI